jgi:hypothetical protein
MVLMSPRPATNPFYRSVARQLPRMLATTALLTNTRDQVLIRDQKVFTVSAKIETPLSEDALRLIFKGGDFLEKDISLFFKALSQEALNNCRYAIYNGGYYPPRVVLQTSNKTQEELLKEINPLSEDMRRFRTSPDRFEIAFTKSIFHLGTLPNILRGYWTKAYLRTLRQHHFHDGDNLWLHGNNAVLEQKVVTGALLFAVARPDFDPRDPRYFPAFHLRCRVQNGAEQWTSDRSETMGDLVTAGILISAFNMTGCGISFTRF